MGVWVGLLKTMRPHQWVKNLFVLAPLVFAQELFDLPVALRAAIGFALFCLTSSTVYILNDLQDVDADRAHPVKQNRPIAAGIVPERTALRAALTLGASCLLIAALVDLWFAATLAAYLTMNRAYSTRLKHVAYVDVLCIATGFEFRVLGGSFAAGVPASAYLLTVTFLLAAFLGFGKRMHELRQGEGVSKQRAALSSYSERTLTALLVITAVATVGTYAVYTLDPAIRAVFKTDYLIVTSIFTVIGVFRFLQLVRGRPHAESPTEEMLRDLPFLANLVMWSVTVLIVIYFF